MQHLRAPASARPAVGARSSPAAAAGRRLLPSAARPLSSSRLAAAQPRRFVGYVATHESTAYKDLTIGVPKETAPGERRVAATPATVEQLLKAGFRRVLVERGAGSGADLPDSAYAAAGATMVGGGGGGGEGGEGGGPADGQQHAAFAGADVVLKVRPPTIEEARALREGATLVSHIAPARNGALLAALREKKATVVAMDCVPRQLSRAQTFDALSSMANIAGYRAVIEAAHHLGRFFAGQITAAGRVPPAKVLVIGGGVAGLAAAGAARSLGAAVRVFDTREAVREQAKSQGAEFLTVDVREPGEGQGGYAKEMSAAFIEAELALFADQCRQVDVIVATALIPDKPAPRLLTKSMIDSMRPGSVVVDLAAEAGGNCEYTVPGEVFVVPGNGVSVIGFTDLPSRLPQTASSLYSNNVSKFLLSMGPFSTGEEGRFAIDHEDEAVRGALVLEKGELRWPAPPPKSIAQAQAQAQAQQAAAAAAAAEGAASNGDAKPAAAVSPEDAARAATLKSALTTTGAAAATLALGALSPGPAFSGMLTKFGLASISGYQTVWGVSPALHSPLMSVTNAISGLTAVGGMVLAGGGLYPQTKAQWLAAAAVACSAVNIGGGFTVTRRMLDMFKRPTDPPEHNALFLIPGVALLGGFAAGTHFGLDEVTSSTYLVSSACCIAAIACLSKQSSARTGNALGMLGVAGGIVATLGTLLAATASAEGGGGAPDYATAAQLVAVLGAGGAVGATVASRIAITELPQSVAATHALVGLAATLTAIATVSSPSAAGGGPAAAAAAVAASSLDGLHATTAFLSDWIGAVTLTGSAVAFGKLQGALPSAPLSLPGKGALNLALAAVSVALGALLVGGGYAAAGLSPEGVLGATALVAGALGAHLVASIGGADMPVVITLLNSYSGYALCAEGFLLNNDLLTTVGALVGSSGAILSFIMCESMNRSLPNVIFGGFGNAASKPKTAGGGGAGNRQQQQQLQQHEQKGPVSTMGVAEAAEALSSARRVLIVPGYGMAVSGASRSCSELAKMLAAKGVAVEFGVHPVAGRMPGQLNVLLAEAGVDYDLVKEMDEVNPRMEEYDVALVIGANDVVNSASKEDPSSVLFGMPSIEVWRCRQMIFSKRSLAAGYAGADNLCFYKANGALLLGDAKATLDALRAEIEGRP